MIVNAGRRRSQAETEVLEVAAAAATEQKTHHGLIIVFVSHVGPVALGQIEVQVRQVLHGQFLDDLRDGDFVC